MTLTENIKMKSPNFPSNKIIIVSINPIQHISLKLELRNNKGIGKVEIV